MRKEQATKGKLGVTGPMNGQPLPYDPEHNLSLSMTRPQLRIIIARVQVLCLSEKSVVSALGIKI